MDAIDPKTTDAALPDDDHTVVVERSARAKPLFPKPRAARKRATVPPRLAGDAGERAVTAAGADATARYPPRAIASPRPPVPTTTAGPATPRAPAEAIPSVARHARLMARAAVAVFVASCVASVAGLTLIALSVLVRR